MQEAPFICPSEHSSMTGATLASHDDVNASKPRPDLTLRESALTCSLGNLRPVGKT